jgi:hypothetical protein
MKNIVLFFLMIFVVSLSYSLSAQTTVYHPTFVKQAAYADVTPPLREMKLIQIRKKRNAPDREVQNRIGMKEFNHRVTHPFLLPEDPIWQKQDGTYLPLNPAPLQNFEGIGNLSGVYPPDTQGDVGPDKYVQVVNVNFAVYSKTGTVLLGPAAISTIFAGIPAPWNGTNSGDPVVLYDQVASRWLISEFSLPSGNYAELVAISQTSDPTGAWYRYVFQFGNKMPDYPKFGIWPDGYYLSFNQFVGGSTWGGVGACALERTKMLTGDPTAQMVYIDLGATGDPACMLPSDWDGTTAPIANEPNYFTYFNDWSSPTEDYLKIWQFHVDWTTTANSTLSEAYSLVTASFNSEICTATRGRCIPQPGTSIELESLSDRLMYRLQYRNFGSYRAMVTNHTVNVDGNGHAGIRWYELRNTGSAWTIYQQGTYSPDASHRWVGSVAMNANGDIALGYSVSNSTDVYPTIRYTGRRATDALGQMTVAEQTIIDGTGNQTGSACRWGDYSGMSVDPTDDQTFWFTTEYIQTSGGANWKTRIASFKLSYNPTVTTLAANPVTETSATINGTINPNGLASTYYFDWGTTISYGNSTPATPAGSGISNTAVSANISGLIPGTPYHYRIVGVNSDGTTNGNDMTYTPGVAGITTTAVTAITVVSATSGGNVIYDGGSSVTARGVCWGTAANPTLTGNHTTDGSGLGVFTSSITGLSSITTYHIRAYAINGNGTFYGDDLSFTTPCGVYSLPYNENFATTTIPVCWSQIDHKGNGQIWQFGTMTGYSPNPALTGNYAYLNSDAYGFFSSQNADLITPTLNLTGFTNITLQFNHYFRYYTGSSGTVSYSINNGSTWTTIITFTSTTTNPAAFNQVIAALGDQSQVKIKWNYMGSDGWYWAIDDVQITCNSFPVSVSIAPSSNPICAGTSVTFTATPANGGTTPSYQWKVNGTDVGTNGTTYSYTPVNNDVVTCVLTSNASCVTGNPATSNRVIMTVNTIPEQPGTISGSTSICQNTTNTYSISEVSGATSYTWTLPPGWSGSSSATSIDATADSSSGNITVTANNFCGPGPAQSKSVSVVIVPAQVLDTNITVLNGQDNCYTATQTITIAGNNTTFIVQNGGSATMIAGQTISYLPGASVDSGGYMHGYIITGVCCGVGGLAPSIVANQSAINSSEILSIPGLGSTYFKVYPNPTSGNFILELNGDFASSVANVEVFGMQGEKVLSTVLTGEQKHEFSLSDRPAGIYFIRVSSGNKAASAKIIKQ